MLLYITLLTNEKTHLTEQGQICRTIQVLFVKCAAKDVVFCVLKTMALQVKVEFRSVHENLFILFFFFFFGGGVA